MSAASAFQASGPLPSATYAGWDAQTKQEPLWVSAGTAGGQNAAGPAGAVQFSDGAGIFEGTANATLDGTGVLTLAGDAIVGLNLSVGGTANIGGAATVGTDLIVANDVTASGNISCGNLTLSGNAVIAGNVGATDVTASGAVSGATLTASGALAGASLACAGTATIGGSATVTGNLSVGGSFAPGSLNLPYGAGMGTPTTPVTITGDSVNFQMVGNKAYITQTAGLGTIAILCDPALVGTFPVVTCVTGSGGAGGLGVVSRAMSVVSGAWRFTGTNWGNLATYQITWI